MVYNEGNFLRDSEFERSVSLLHLFKLTSTNIYGLMHREIQLILRFGNNHYCTKAIKLCKGRQCGGVLFKAHFSQSRNICLSIELLP